MPEIENNSEPKSEGEAPTEASVWRRAISTPEGKILIAGVVLACLHLTAIALTLTRSSELFHSLLSMTGTHIIGGRAAGITWGYAQELPRWVVTVASMSIETFMVLLFYPLFVFSYRSFIVIEPLRETMARARQAAQAHQKTIMKYGIPGLLLFVWFPFWMTGPLVGSVIGFLIGLRAWVNMIVVLAGTWLAIFCWSLILQRIYEKVKVLGPYVPFAIVALILLFAISIHIRYAFSKHARQPRNGSDRE